MPPTFVGTWHLVSQHTVRPDGTTAPSRGDNPMGMLMYDPLGNMAVQLMRTDDHAADYTNLAALETAMQGFHAYFGRYEIDEANGIIRHFVTGSGYFDYRGTTQIRHYAFSADANTLTLRAGSPHENTTRVLVWRRATEENP